MSDQACPLFFTSVAVLLLESLPNAHRSCYIYQFPLFVGSDKRYIRDECIVLLVTLLGK